VDGVVIRGRDYTAMGEDQASDYGSTMGGERDSFWILVMNPAGAGEVSRLEKNLVRMW